MDLFGIREKESNGYYPEVQLKAAIESGNAKQTVDLLLLFNKEDLNHALARCGFKFGGSSKHEIINHIQNDLMKACRDRQVIRYVPRQSDNSGFDGYQMGGQNMKKCESDKMTPMDRLFLKAKMSCTKCEQPAGTCDCWIKCVCGWSYYKDDNGCENPECKAH